MCIYIYIQKYVRINFGCFCFVFLEKRLCSHYYFTTITIYKTEMLVAA